MSTAFAQHEETRLKHLVLAGSGYAHVGVLQALARQPLAVGAVTLITPFERAVYAGRLPGLVAGRRDVAACSVPLASLAAAAKVRWLALGLSALDAQARTVTLSSGQVLPFDVLSLDGVTVADRDAIPGAREQALFARPAEHFVIFWQRLLALAEHRTLDVVVVGGGPSGFELAMALSWRLRRTGSGASRVALVTGGGPALADGPAELQRRAEQALLRRRITVLRARCVALTAEHAVLDNGARLACDAPVLALGRQPPAWLADSGLALDAQGRVATSGSLQSVSHPGVLAVGEVASRPQDAQPWSDWQTVRAAPALAENLRLLMGGAQALTCPTPKHHLRLTACGPNEALGAWGPWAARGRWLGWLKDRRERAVIRAWNLSSSGGR